MDFMHDLDDLLSQMEDIKIKKTPPVPPPKPKPTASQSNNNNSQGTTNHVPGFHNNLPTGLNRSKSNGSIVGKQQMNGHDMTHKHLGNGNCPHMDDMIIYSRADTHPHVPHPHPLNLDEHMTSNTLFPTPAPPSSNPNQRPVSPIMQGNKGKREVIKSPFDPETPSDQLKKFGINDSNEDFKFNSYHLDYKYTPPPIKGPCVACGEGIIGPLVTALDQMWHPEHFCCANCDRELRPPYFLEHDGEPYCKCCHQKLFLPPCAACGKFIPDKYINAMGKVWHPECFVCTHCNVMLPEKDFKEKNGKPYCEKDYHDLFSPKCFACKKPITDGKKTAALGRDWHPQCFKCAKCGCVLNPNKFYEKDGKPYCEDDFNDMFLPKCAGCNTPIKQNATRVMGKTWHPHCFKCTECKKTLSPQKYFEKNGIPYCEDDFHKKFSPKCAGCTAPIKDTPTHAMGKTWHPQCFKCSVCSKNLTPNNYFEKDGIPYCEDDFHNKFSPKCFNCNGPIKQNPTKAMGKLWHPHCFKCTECSKQLSPSQFREKNGNPYCEEHYHKLFSPKCYACKQPITDGKPLAAMGQTWHPEHFSCSDCGKNLTPSNFFEKNGRLYCEEDYHLHFSPKCASCTGPIKDNRAVVAMGENWHPECFRCTACNRQLAENAFYEHDGKAYCVDDFMNMFAPKCRGCKQPIKDAYCLYALNSDWHPSCFRCKDCNTLLEETNFFEFEGEPFCERHYHERMCPDCIKMRRALERYCGRSSTTTMTASSSSTTSTTNRPAGSQQAFRTLNLPPRPNSRQSQNQSPTPDHTVNQKVRVHDINTHHTSHNHTNQSQSQSQSQNLTVPQLVVNDERPMSSQSQYSMESTYKEQQRNGSLVSPYSGSESAYSAIRTPSPMPSCYWNGNNNSNINTSQQSGSNSSTTVNSGKFPVGPQMFQFETTFKKEEYQSISRY